MDRGLSDLFSDITVALRILTLSRHVDFKVDNQLSRYHAIRSDRISSKGEKVVRTLPSRDGVPGGHEAGIIAIIYTCLLALTATPSARIGL